MAHVCLIDLTPSQSQAMGRLEAAIAAGERLFVLWYGGIRAGKSVGACLLMLRHSMEREGQTYIVGGFTQRQVQSILGPIFERYAKYYELPFKQFRGSQNPRFEIGGNHFLIFGGGDAGKDAAVQGLTASGLLLDEYSLLHPEFVAQCEARTSDAGALRVYTSNKASPYHWTTLHYYNRMAAGDIPGLLLDSGIAENQHIDQSFITERLAEYGDAHSARFMANDFVLPSMPVYQPLTDDKPDGEPTLSVVIPDRAAYRVITAIDTDYGVCVMGEQPGSHDTIAELAIGPTVLIDASRPMIARELRAIGKRVRGFTSGLGQRRIERAQRAFAGGTVRVHPRAFTILRALDEYAIVGMYPSPIVCGIEFMAEYVARGLNGTGQGANRLPELF